MPCILIHLLYRELYKQTSEEVLALFFLLNFMQFHNLLKLRYLSGLYAHCLLICIGYLCRCTRQIHNSSAYLFVFCFFFLLSLLLIDFFWVLCALFSAFRMPKHRVHYLYSMYLTDRHHSAVTGYREQSRIEKGCLSEVDNSCGGTQRISAHLACNDSCICPQIPHTLPTVYTTHLSIFFPLIFAATPTVVVVVASFAC